MPAKPRAQVEPQKDACGHFCVLANRECQDPEPLRLTGGVYPRRQYREISRHGRGHAWEISAEVGLYRWKKVLDHGQPGSNCH